MQPTPTPAHPGPAEPDGPGPASAPVHGTAVPSQRHVLAASPITEATTEMPVIVPNSIDRPGPSPLPPIATQLLGGVAQPATAAPQADTDTEPDTDSPQAETEPVDDSDAVAVAGDPDTVGPDAAQQDAAQQDAAQQDAAQQDPTASVPEPGGEGQDGEPGFGPSDEQSATAGADDDAEQAVAEAGPEATAESQATAEPEAGAADEESEHAVNDTQPADVEGQPEPDMVDSAADREHAEATAQDEAEEDDEPESVTAHGDAGDLFYLDDEYDAEDEPEDDGSEDDEDEEEEAAAVLTTVEEQVEPATAEAAAEAPTNGSERSAAKRPGDVSLPPITIWSEAVADELRDEWHEIKARFVDEPEVAVAQAQSLVAHTVRTLAERLLAEQVEIDPHRHSEAPDTESMRMALRHYREFLDRLLAI